MLGAVKTRRTEMPSVQIGWRLSMSNPEFWVDICTDEKNGEQVVTVGASTEELEKKGWWRHTTFLGGERV